jgi:uncharacterized protein (DUF1499 family)
VANSTSIGKTPARRRALSLVFACAAALATLLASAILTGPAMASPLSGQRPDDFGVREGRLKPPSATENSVSSQAVLYDGPGAQYARIAPLAVSGDGAAAMARLAGIVAAWPGARIVTHRPDYLHAEFSSRWLGFVDDTEFWYSPAEGVIHVRSASRLGRRDFGVNRERVEAIRAAYGH